MPGVAKPKVTLSLTEATLCLNEPGEEDIPKEHELIVASVSKQAIGVFSFENDEVTDVERVRMEGKIQQRLECRPFADKSYIKLKAEEMKKVSQPVRQLIQIDRAVQNYKPVSDHKHNASFFKYSTSGFTSFIGMLFSFRLPTHRKRRQKGRSLEMIEIK